MSVYMPESTSEAVLTCTCTSHNPPHYDQTYDSVAATRVLDDRLVERVSEFCTHDSISTSPLHASQSIPSPFIYPYSVSSHPIPSRQPSQKPGQKDTHGSSAAQRAASPPDRPTCGPSQAPPPGPTDLDLDRQGRARAPPSSCSSRRARRPRPRRTSALPASASAHR